MSEPDAGPEAGRTYRLVGREASGLELAGRRLSPCIGREGELALLLARVRDAADGLGHAVTLIGEPGVGKSRLLYELRQALPGQGVTWVEARCMSDGAGVPYLPLAQLLRQSCELADDDPMTSAAATVPVRLAALGLDADALAPGLLVLLGAAPAAMGLGSPRAGSTPGSCLRGASPGHPGAGTAAAFDPAH